MPHVIEAARSGRATCRGCGQRIAKDELRCGERLPNPFGEGEMTLWFHVLCAAYKRPAAFLEALDSSDLAPGDLQGPGSSHSSNATGSIDALRQAAQIGLRHHRLPRVDGAQRAPSGRARCRSCREVIDKGSWRISLVFFDDGRFQPAGFIHVACAREYFGTAEILDRAHHFEPDLEDADLESLRDALIPPR